MSDFDLRSFMRSIIDAHPDEPNPHRLAEKALAELPSEHWRDALAVSLADQFRTFAYLPPIDLPAASQLSNRSLRHERASVVSRFRAERVCIDEKASVWKSLNECTQDEVRSLAEYRRADAAELLAKAEMWTRLADKMRTFRAVTVADLDDGLLAEVLR